MVTFPDGRELSLVQTLEIGRLLREHGGHWHMNRCGCCATVHGSDVTFVVGRDGGSNMYPGRGCECPPGVDTRVSDG